MINRFFAAFLVLSLVLPVQALAWGKTGHAMIGLVAAESLPGSVPAFVRSHQAIAEIEALGPEEDNIKGSGQSWDADNDPGHFLDIGDDGTVAGVVRLDALPSDMEAYTQALAGAGTSPYRVGFVPYEIMDGFERVRKDFAYWRVDAYMSQHAATTAARQAFAWERALRETLTLRDIGDFGHFVGDGSQPLHITIHYNGWGKYPNPHAYTTEPIHSAFESEFVNRYARTAAVRALVPTYAPVNPSHLMAQAQIATLVGNYLSATATQVVPLYTLYGRGAFASGSREAIAFSDKQLARGATMLRNLTALAWEDSRNGDVDYPPIKVRDVLNGTVVPRQIRPLP